MKCEEFKSMVQTRLDQSVETALSLPLQDHVDTCPECSTFFESLLATHRALSQLSRVNPSTEFVDSLKRIGELDTVSVKLSWGPEIRLASVLLAPVVLPYLADVFSLEVLPQILEMIIVSLGLTLFGIAVLKPELLGDPEFRIVPENLS